MTDPFSSVVAVLDQLGSAMLEWVLWMNLWTAALLVGAFLLDRVLKRYIAPSWRVVFFLAVIARLLVPVSAHSPIGAVASPTVTIVSGVVPESATSSAATSTVNTSSGAVEFPATEGSITFLTAVPLLYGSVVLVLILAWWSSVRRLRGIINASRPISAERATMVARMIPQLDISRVREHASAGPLLIGVVRPTLVLPTRLLQSLGDQAIAAVLRHERAHLARRDPILATLLHLTVIAAWPVLAVWFAAARIRTLLELACDERALEGADSAVRADYGRTLLAFASRERAASAALTFAGGLSERIAALRKSRRLHPIVQLAVVAPIAVVLVACAAQRTTEAQQVEANEGALQPVVLNSASPEPHKGSQDVQFTILEGVPRDPKLDAFIATAATDGSSTQPLIMATSEFDQLLTHADARVISRPRVYAILGLPFSIDIGSTGADGKLISGLSLNARVAMITKQREDSQWTYRLEVNYSEALDGAIIAGPSEHEVSVFPGETAVILVRARDGNPPRLVCVSANRASSPAPEITGAATAATPQTSQAFQTLAAPLDPQGNEYPRVFWMLNVYEVPGPVEIANNGLVRTTTHSKPNTFASIPGSSFGAVIASIDAIAGRTQLATPVLLERFDVDGSVTPESRDKAGQSLVNRLIKIRTAQAEAGFNATFEVTVSAGAFSVSSRIANRMVPVGDAVVLSTPGANPSDPWTVTVARPQLLRSVKDYPFQTSSGAPE